MYITNLDFGTTYLDNVKCQSIETNVIIFDSTSISLEEKSQLEQKLVIVT